ncbi:aromatic acid exporter family protein [Psychrobacillus psychrodurans]|uniref:aromatic acid exporter family protein n=1 Tax=Psychrobacillus TaxID=1221880 RepID=UPI001F4EBF23|nr:aromatic acid exporter family protein [Psychrobacillus psychrodurans]MCK1996037.1 aromatic acid exporter family protein [Psychrobacillus psychrodurans]
MIGFGYRTIKTAVGAGLAIWIASLLDLEFATFAAIIVIMCIEKTKKKTLITIKDKFFTSLLSLILGALLFELLGYNPIVFSLFIILFVPLLVRAHIQGGFVTSMVVVLHVYTVKDANWAILLNELYIIFIGMGIALLVNSFMPNLKRDIEIFKREIEQKFEVILFEFSAHLRDSMRNWDGKEILEVEELINQSKSIAIQDVENHLLRKQNKDYYYLEMREDQLELLKHMMKIVAIFSSSSLDVKQKEMIAEFLENLSRNVHSGDTTDISLNELEDLNALIRKMDLPKTREEFEVRANLFYLIFEMKNYLNIKKKLFVKRSR